MTNVDVIIAGAGIWGSTLARRFAEAGRKVLVLEKRRHVGGNVRCEIDAETGIEIHSYGSHIFHTSLPEVWEFINRFTDFNGYQHKVLARYKGRTYFLPLGLALVNAFFGVELTPAELPAFMADEAHSSAIFDAFFRGYTSKQWGRAPEDVDPSIIKRVPVRATYDVNYFNDYCQGIPSDGYNSIFERLLDHPNIKVRCDAGVRLENGIIKVGADDLPGVPVYYSGPVDALFNYRLGVLPWRTLKFETEKLDIADYQGTSVVNYTEVEVPYTRIHEFKHYHPELKEIMAKPKTIVMREYSAEWKLGDEPYYPIDTAQSRELLAAYKAEAEKIPNLILGGRLGAYKYFDMDKSIESALKIEISE
ncbi:MAG: NAD(P)-binding protein [Kiritimatiellae bacterium]|nr:NAD(P)-binding protein [Kiritimatiellia bacterium]